MFKEGDTATNLDGCEDFVVFLGGNRYWKKHSAEISLKRPDA